MQSKKHLVVTGASSGIGFAITERALADGWMVTGVSRTAAAFSSSDFRHAKCDLADPGETADCASRLESVDGIVHAAGFMSTASLEAASIEAGDAMWRLHVGAVVQLASALAPKLQEGGRIVLIGSRVANGVAGRSQYSAVKAAQIGLARSWAAELIGRGITVNVVAPGATDTPMLRDPSRQSSAPRVPPIGRLIQPEEVAAAVAFLLSPSAAAITGQTLTICGGASL
jgi:NAD(P)-dependent dehydrogenase (short-subunit alcohol dehydrogenase family)